MATGKSRGFGAEFFGDALRDHGVFLECRERERCKVVPMHFPHVARIGRRVSEVSRCKTTEEHAIFVLRIDVGAIECCVGCGRANPVERRHRGWTATRLTTALPRRHDGDNDEGGSGPT